MNNLWWKLFFTFVKINLLTTSGSAAAGFAYTQIVDKLLTREEFIEAVGYSNVLPGSDALQLALFVGYRVGGVRGAIVACLGAILPPTVLIMIVATVLTRLRGEAWIASFVKGLTPALAALFLIAAYNLIVESGAQTWTPLLLGAISLLAVAVLKVPPALVLLAAGLVGILVFR